MPDAEPLTYAVTPGPEVLAKMGASWTLFTMPPVLFTVGPDGELPEPATLTLTVEQAADLADSGYLVAVASFTIPEPVNDLEGVEPGAESFVRGDLRRVEQERAEQPREHLITGTGVPDAMTAPPRPFSDFVGREETMAGEPGEGIQGEAGTQADGSLTEPIRRRKA